MSFGTHRDVGDVARREAQYNAALSAAFKGSTTGFAVAGPAAYIMHRQWPAFRALTLPIKAFFVVSASIATGVIAADKAGIAFDQDHYTDRGAAVSRRYRTVEEKEWAELPARDRILTWTKDNKFGVVAGSWVTSMLGTFAYINTQPLSFAQKLVQARVWAQGLTLISLVSMAAITQIPSAGDRLLEQRQHASDHSWKDFVGESDSGGKDESTVPSYP
ncbi:hypothetical protein IE53DRAFT_385208 [Violaceomyces palustris]|uniref:Uncharacterized protein n=1 Tax=Violaceomyces palustris TaxID=1673888 RepID=A0ACD0P2T7_9BASI|nr:hypothetical protein IE53DRAFT_385208 [Violaceomyces palustris]